MEKISLEVGKKAPAFRLPGLDGKLLGIEDFNGKNIVIYFYPKDNTPGCTLEAEGFRDAKYEFEKLDTVIIGVSKDSINSHEKFCKKHELNFYLLSDENQEAIELYDVLRLKKMFGKEYMGVERSTFVIDKKGTLVKEYRKVRVKGHVEKVMEFIASNL